MSRSRTVRNKLDPLDDRYRVIYHGDTHTGLFPHLSHSPPVEHHPHRAAKLLVKYLGVAAKGSDRGNRENRGVYSGRPGSRHGKERGPFVTTGFLVLLVVVIVVVVDGREDVNGGSDCRGRA